MSETKPIRELVFRITPDCIQSHVSDIESMITANFFPGQLCRMEVYENKIVITPEDTQTAARYIH